MKKVLIHASLIITFIFIYLLQSIVFTNFTIASVMPNMFIILVFNALCGRCLLLQRPGIDSWSLRLYFRSLCVAYLRRKIYEQVDTKLFLEGSDGHHVAFLDSAVRVSVMIEPDRASGISTAAGVTKNCLVVRRRNCHFLASAVCR